MSDDPIDFYPTCAVCGIDVHLKDRTVQREVTGWVTRRNGGGVNHVAGQTETGRYRCSACAAHASAVHHRALDLFEELQR